MNRIAGDDETDWTLTIRPHNSWLDLQLTEIWNYRDLLLMFVRRDFVAVYKQTVLGPIWFFLQPLLTTLVFTLIFSGVAGLSTDGLPPLLFYLAGTIPWNYFSTCLTKTATTFTANAAIFGKVYFPRLIVPISIVASSLIQLAIQLVLLGFVLVSYGMMGHEIKIQWALAIFLIPLVIILIASLSLGAGILVSAMTTKYRDFTFLLNFGIQLGMYITPVIYPLSAIDHQWRWLMGINPLAAQVETFRAVLTGSNIPWFLLLESSLSTFLILILGLLVFNKVEKNFMDTV